MIELLRSNDPVLLSFVETLLKAADVPYFLADGHMSMLEGQVGILPRRLLMAREDLAEARALLTENGLAGSLGPDAGGHG
jgi:hypothetical protein